MAAAHGLRLKRAPGPSGLATLMAEPGADVEAVEAALEADPRLDSVDRAGAIYSASTGRGALISARAAEWHLEAAGAPDRADYDLGGYVVAVIDTGIALSQDGRRSAMPSLASVPLVAPWDFVEGDSRPDDLNHHGSLVASIVASDGGVQGVAAGVSLMPLRVLDAAGEGTEADLVDAIVYAVDEGADVVCLSLAFGDSYTPSVALEQALETAWDAGVVVVSAAGNGGRLGLAWPAASPLVLSVGATQPAADGGLSLAPYANWSRALDILAPGGSLADDVNSDGLADGILSEGIDPADPDRVATWLSAGTSQATAIVAGAAVHLLAAGADGPSGVRQALREGQRPLRDARRGLTSLSSGELDIGASISAIEEGRADPGPVAARWISSEALGESHEEALRAAGLVGDPLEVRVSGLNLHMSGQSASIGRGNSAHGGAGQRTNHGR